MSADHDDVAKAAEIVAAYVANNPIAPQDIPALIERVHGTLVRARVSDNSPRQPAIDPDRSVSAAEVVCLECGRSMRFLRRHLMAAHDLTPDSYRSRWNLPASHALTAPSYSTRRSDIAKEIGLGTRNMKNKSGGKGL
jgi:predicted transcriptional regulator